MKNPRHCDILIVGAGPAGSSAALTAAKLGVGVLVAERRKTIGVPVRCAGYIPRPLLAELPFRDRSFVLQPVKAMRAMLPDGTVKETRAPGLIIRRDRFDQLLAESAQRQGARVCTGWRAVSKEADEILLKDARGDVFRTRPSVVIGADGPHSTVGRWMDRRPPRLIPGIQVRVPMADPTGHTEVYFHPRIFGAYGWVFPRGTEANVGLALAGGEGFPLSLRRTLEWFVGRVAEQGKIKADSKGLTFGWIPVAPRHGIVYQNMLLAGDAAGHTHPITGAGIAHAMLAGRLAAECAVEAVKKGDVGVLRGYDEAIKAELGETLSRGTRRRQLLESQWDRLSEVLPRCWTGFRAYYRDDQSGASE